MKKENTISKCKMNTRMLEKLFSFSQSVYSLTLIVLTTIVLTMSSGCKEWLELTPENDLVLEDFWQTEQQALSELGACYMAYTYDLTTDYADIKEGGLIYQMLLCTEGRSDNTVPYIYNSDIEKLSEGDITSTNYFTNWSPYYRVINYCNLFLHFGKEAVAKDENFSMAELKSMNAEATAMRSLAYFDLVRIFKDVPYISEATLNDQQDFKISKSSGDSIIKTLINDLETVLPDATFSFTKLVDAKGRFTKNGIHALLADLYLWDEQYDMCVYHCDQIIKDDQFELVDGETALYDIFYRGNSRESIFEFQFGEKEDGYQYNTGLVNLYGNSSTSPILHASNSLAKDNPNSPFYRSYDDGREDKDLRYLDYIRDNNSDSKYIFKYAGLQRIERSEGAYSYLLRRDSPNWIVYRYADVLLMKAEALVQIVKKDTEVDQDNYSENNISVEDSVGLDRPEVKTIMKLVNTTFLRSNPDLGSDSLLISDYSDINSIEALVLRERHRELLFEGKRWFDLLRAARRADDPKILLGKVSAKYSGNGNILYLSATNMDALYMPINKGELKANNNLQQNEYYEKLENDLKN